MSKFDIFIDKIKTNIKKNKASLIALVCIWIIVIAVTLFFYKDTLGKQSYGNERYENVIALHDGITIQETMPIYDGSESISIKFATYARKNIGKIHIHVYGNNSRTLYLDKDISTKSLQDNAFLTVKLDKIITSQKEQFITVTLTSDNDIDNAIGVYCSNENVFGFSECKVNSDIQEGDLTVRFLTESEELNKYYTILISWTIIGISFIILFMILCEPKVEVLFAVMAAIIGLAFCFLMTPLSIPDEFAHYEYSFQVSNYMTFEDNHLLVDGDYKDYGQYRGHRNVSSAYKKVLKRFNSEFVPDGVMEEMDNDVDDIYSLCFVPQAIGITIARILNFNRVRLFYLGRIFNLAFYVLCVYLAIKKTPIHKLLFGIISTLPMFMQQAASYSYDCFINGLTILTISYLLNFIFRKEQITNKELIFVLIVNALLAPAKTVYGFFSLLFWFVPFKNYGSKKKKTLCTLILCLPAIYQLFIITKPIVIKVFKNISELAINTETNTIDSNGGFGVVNEKITVGYMVRNPLETIMLFARTIRFSLKNWLYDSMGRTLSGMSLILPINLVHILVIAPFVASFRKEIFVESVSLKITFILVCGIIVLYIMGGFILSWTDMSQTIVDDYGGIIIQGIQGRYFSPLLPFALSVFNNKKISIPQKFDKYIIFTQLMVLFEVIAYVLSYTFVN